MFTVDELVEQTTLPRGYVHNRLKEHGLDGRISVAHAAMALGVQRQDLVASKLPWVDAETVASQLNMSRIGVYKAVAHGRLRAVHSGVWMRFTPKDITTFADLSRGHIDRLPGEIWRRIPCGHWRYLASNKGRFCSCQTRSRWRRNSTDVRRRLQLIRPGTPQDGHAWPRIRVTTDSGPRTLNAPHVILELFKGKAPKPNMVPKAKDGNIRNMSIENLDWVPITEIYRERCKEGNWGKKLSPRNVMTIRNMRAKGATLQSIADKFGIDISTVSLIASRRRWTYLA